MNPKNYPKEYWLEVINSLIKGGWNVWQIGGGNEEKLTEQTKFNLSFKELKNFCSDMYTFISVDNFFPHFCYHYNLPNGIVIFSKSSPTLFGYEENINAYKDKKYFRPDQFGLWESCDWDKESFLKPNEILDLL